jgi:hypothetical protein
LIALQKSKFDSVEALIELFRKRGILTGEEAESLIRRSQKAAVREEEQKQASEQEIKEEVQAELKEELREEVRAEVREDLKEDPKQAAEKVARASVPEWTKRIGFGGDVRLRYQGDFFYDNNAILLDPADTTEILNTRIGRNRFRYRLRLP